MQIDDLRLSATLLGDTGRTKEAEARLAQASPLLLKSSGENSLPYMAFLNTVGAVKRTEGDFAGAAAAFRTAIELCDRIAPGDSPSLTPQMNLCIVLFALGKTSEMEPVVHRLIEDARRILGENSALYHSVVMPSTLCDFAAGDYPKMVPATRQFLTSMGPNYSDGMLDMVQTRALLGTSLVRTGHAAEGEEPLRNAYEHGQKIDKVEFAHTVGNLETALGECLLAQGRCAEAEPLLLTGLDNLEKRLGPQNRFTVQATHRLHDLYLAWNKPTEAARFADNATIQPPPPP